MRRINRDRRQQRINFLFAVCVNIFNLLRLKLFKVKNADVLARQRRHQLFVPALILLLDKFMSLPGNQLAFLLSSQRIRAGVNEAIFNPLEQPCYPDLKEFIQIAGGNGQEFDPFQNGVAFIIGLFQHSPVKGQPGSFTIYI